MKALRGPSPAAATLMVCPLIETVCSSSSPPPDASITRVTSDPSAHFRSSPFSVGVICTGATPSLEISISPPTSTMISCSSEISIFRVDWVPVAGSKLVISIVGSMIAFSVVLVNRWKCAERPSPQINSDPVGLRTPNQMLGKSLLEVPNRDVGVRLANE